MTLTLAKNIQNSEEKIALERSRITGERVQHVQSNAQARAACYQNFAVNACLEKQRAEHAARMDDLRRQEIALNDAQRKESGAKQMQNIDDKLSAEKQAAAAKNREEALQRTQERLAGAEQKRADKANKEQELLQNPPAPRLAKTPAALPSKPTIKTKAVPNVAEQAVKAAANRQAYEERQTQAAQRKTQLEKKRAEAKKPPAAGLPVPKQ